MNHFEYHDEDTSVIHCLKEVYLRDKAQFKQ